MLGELLHEIHDAGLRLGASEDEHVLQVWPSSNLTPELSVAIKEHKDDLIRVVRENQRFRETGIIQSEHQVFALAREFFGLDKQGGIT
jgi:hypothetical protein